MRVRVLAVVALLAVAGCSEDKQGPVKTKPADDVDMPPPIEPPERATGMQACETYHARVCACAQAHADMAEECRLAEARPSSLAELFEMLDGTTANLGPKARRVTLKTARKTIRMCFEADAALDPVKCPRVTSPGSPTSL